MASTSISRMYGRGHLYHSLLLGARGFSLWHGGDLRAPFLFGFEVPGMLAHRRPRVRPSPVVLPYPVKHAFPSSPDPS
jgi:hypothetical protein